MSLFANLYPYKNYNMFNEIEVDGNQVQDQEPPADYTAPEGQATEPVNDTPQEEIPEQQAQEQQPEQNPDTQNPEPDQPEDTSMDYTQASDADMGAHADGAGSQDGGASVPAPAREESEVDDIKTREEELFNLTQEELDVKHDELKKRYLDMFDITTDIIERIGDAAVTEKNMEVIEFVTNNLNSIREMLTDYMNSIYKTKSYIENSINYNRFLAVLNGIQKMLEEIVIKKD